MRVLRARNANLNTMHEIMCTACIIYNFFSNSKNNYSKQIVHVLKTTRFMKAKT